MTLLLALPPWGVSVELQPYKFDESAQYYHVFGNYAAAAARTHFRWHNTNPWHASAGMTSQGVKPLAACRLHVDSLLVAHVSPG